MNTRPLGPDTAGLATDAALGYEYHLETPVARVPRSRAPYLPLEHRDAAETRAIHQWQATLQKLRSVLQAWHG